MQAATRRKYKITSGRKKSSDCMMAAHLGDDQQGAVFYAMARILSGQFDEATA